MASRQLVVFEIAQNEFGIDIKTINGILRAKKFTIQKVPGVPPSVEGVINLRGKICYIFNLNTRFGLPPEAYNEERKIIMVYANDLIIGCLVNEVTDIVKLDENDIEPTPAFIAGVDARYIIGIGKIDDRMITILDPNEVLTADTVARITENSIA